MGNASFYLSVIAILLAVVAGWRINLLHTHIKQLRVLVTEQQVAIAKLETVGAP